MVPRPHLYLILSDEFGGVWFLGKGGLRGYPRWLCHPLPGRGRGSADAGGPGRTGEEGGGAVQVSHLHSSVGSYKVSDNCPVLKRPKQRLGEILLPKQWLARRMACNTKA